MYRKAQLTDLLSLFIPFALLGTGKDKMLSVKLHAYVYMFIVVLTPVTHSKQATTSACFSLCYITTSFSNAVRAV